MPLLKERLASRCSIVVDDTDRESDREVVERWLAEPPGFERRELDFEKGAVVLHRS